MANFIVWGRIEQIAPNQFVAIASAVRNDGANAKPDVELKVLPTREAAQGALRAIVQSVGSAVTGRGDRVVDVEVDE
jgi:hypothetical protein